MGLQCRPMEQIGAIVKERQLFPLFDAAYLGLTSGDYDRDAFAIRYFADELGLEIAVCLSFAKSMGLYGMDMLIVVFLLRLMLTCFGNIKVSVSDYVPFRRILPLSQLPWSQV